MEKKSNSSFILLYCLGFVHAKYVMMEAPDLYHYLIKKKECLACKKSIDNAEETEKRSLEIRGGLRVWAEAPHCGLGGK